MQRATDDITHLYQEFGGKPQSYRELTRSREAERARDRWPLISRVEDLSAGIAVPPVRAGEDATAEPLRWLAVVPAAQPQSSAAQEPAAERVEPGLVPQQNQAAAGSVLPWLRQPGRRVAPDSALPAAAAPTPQSTPQPPAASAPVAPMFAALHKTSAPAPAAAPRQRHEAPSEPGAAPAPGVARMFASLHERPAPAASGHPPAPTAPPAPPARPVARAPAWSSPRRGSASAPAVPALSPQAAAPGQAPVEQPQHQPAAFTPAGRSPLARLAPPQEQAEPAAAPRAGLQNLFARMLGRVAP